MVIKSISLCYCLGGTESIMTACRLYRNWGYRSKGISRGQTVIIACDTVHAAVHKSGLQTKITPNHTLS